MSEQLANGGFNIGRAHKRFANQKAVHAVLLHEADVVFAADAALGNHQRIVQQIRQQADGLLQIHFKRAQVAVVHAAQRRGELRAAFGFGFVVQFQQNRHAQIVRHLFQMAQFCSAAAISKIAAAPQARA